MSLYKKVWDPHGIMFEVGPEKASDLVLNHGWSNTAPETKRKKGKKSSSSPARTPVADTTEDNSDVAVTDVHYATE